MACVLRQRAQQRKLGEDHNRLQGTPIETALIRRYDQSVLENIAPAEAPGDMFPTAAAEDFTPPHGLDADLLRPGERADPGVQSFVVTPRLNITIDTCVGEDKVVVANFHMKKWPWMGISGPLG
jgi:hypothetical protein